MARLTVPSPLGPLSLTEEDGAITAVSWREGAAPGADTTFLLMRAAEQVAAYFSSEIKVFDLPTRAGTGGLTGAVLAEIATIPHGRTRTYGEIAETLGAPAQAVGQACGANPIPLIIPCHRVVGATGLGGFSGPGGVEDKVFLLKHEGAHALLI